MYFFQGVALVCFCKRGVVKMDQQHSAFSVDGQLRQSQPIQARSSSGTTPLKYAAEGSSYCRLPGSLPPRSRRQLSLLPDRSGPKHLGLEQAISLLCSGGYRISEVLSLRWSDVISEDRVIVKAKKRGTTSMAIIPGISGFCQSIPPSKRSEFVFSCDYGQVYRRMLQLGFAAQPEGHINRTVTHTPRHRLAAQVAAASGLVAASNVLNHRSLTAISHYVPYIPPVKPDIWLFWDNGTQSARVDKNDFLINDKYYIGLYELQSQNERCSWVWGWPQPFNPVVRIRESEYPWIQVNRELSWCPVWTHAWSWQLDIIIGGKLFTFSGTITPS